MLRKKPAGYNLLSFCHYLLLSKFSIYFTRLNLIFTPITLYFFRLNINMQLLQMCIYDTQRYSFKYKINKNTKGLNIRYRKT